LADRIRGIQEWDGCVGRSLEIVWIALNIPTIIIAVAGALSGSREIIEIVEGNDGRTGLNGSQRGDLPAFQQLRPGMLPGRQLVGQRECEAMAQIKIAAGLLVGDVGTVLRNESPVAGTTGGIKIGTDGRATVVGFGPAYFLEANAPPAGCKDKMPLTFRNISVHVAVTRSTFDVKNWKGEGRDDYTLSVNDGQVRAAGSWHAVY